MDKVSSHACIDMGVLFNIHICTRESSIYTPVQARIHAYASKYEPAGENSWIEKVCIIQEICNRLIKS